jgi:hypothetical protein
MLSAGYSSQILIKPGFTRKIFDHKIFNFMKIRPVEAELFHAERRADGQRDEADSHLSQFCERPYKSVTC